MPKWITNATRPYSQIVKLSETTLTHAVREGLRNHNHMKLAVSHSCTKANSPSPANHQVPRSDTPKHLLQTQSDTCQGALSMHALASSLVLWLNQGRYLGTWMLRPPTAPDTLGGVSWKPSPYRHIDGAHLAPSWGSREINSVRRAELSSVATNFCGG